MSTETGVGTSAIFGLSGNIACFWSFEALDVSTLNVGFRISGLDNASVKETQETCNQESQNHARKMVLVGIYNHAIYICLHCIDAYGISRHLRHIQPCILILC